MRMFWRSLLVHSILLLGSQYGFADRQHSREAAGLLSAFHANMLGIDSYELVIDLSESGLKPDESLFESHRTFVLMADYAHSRFLSLTSSKQREDGQVTSCLESSVIQGNRGEQLRCDGKTVVRDQPFDVQLAASTFPDVRLVGHEPFFLPHLPGLFASLQTTYSPAREFKLKALAGNDPHDFRIELPIVRGVNKNLFQKVWYMNSRRLVPTEFSNRVFHPEKEKWIVLSTEHFEWTEIDGFELPSSLIGDRKRVGKGDEGAAVYFDVDYEANFYWLRVNEAIDEKRFDFSDVDNPALVSKAIAKAKAEGKN